MILCGQHTLICINMQGFSKYLFDEGSVIGVNSKQWIIYMF